MQGSELLECALKALTGQYAYITDGSYESVINEFERNGFSLFESDCYTIRAILGNDEEDLASLSDDFANPAYNISQAIAASMKGEKVPEQIESNPTIFNKLEFQDKA